MTHEKRIKDERGKILIEVWLDCSYNLEQPQWWSRVYVIPKGKRNPERNDSIATPEEIHAAKMELYKKIRPEVQ